MATTLTSTGITFPDSTTQRSAVTTTVIPTTNWTVNSPFYICDNLTNNLKRAEFIANTFITGGPATIRLALKFSNTNNDFYGYHAMLIGTIVKGADFNGNGASAYVITAPQTYVVPNTWKVTAESSAADFGGVSTSSYVLTFFSSLYSAGYGYIYQGQMKIFTSLGSYLTGIGLQSSYSGNVTDAVSWVENY